MSKFVLDPVILGAIDINPFLGRMIQCLTIRQNPQVPTAGVGYDVQNNKFNLFYNAEFMGALTYPAQVAVMLHEMYHLVHAHCTSYTHLVDKKRANIAMDIVVNQFIQNLPKEAVAVVENFRLKNGKPFPKGATTDEYYLWLGQDAEFSPTGGKGEKKPDGSGDGDWQPIPKEYSFDVHDFEDLPEEAKKAMMDLIRRTEEKMSMSHDTTPDHILDLVKRLERELADLDYKKLLAKAFKKSMPVRDRTHTWNKPNKRYGYAAPGTRLELAPKVEFFIDTSGSISHAEQDKALRTSDNFLREGHNKCKLHLFHTELYRSINYRIGDKVEDSESGGTDLQCVTNYIEKNKLDLAIILTDGYYNNVSHTKLPCKVLFLISAQGTEDHPLKHLGETIKLKV